MLRRSCVALVLAALTLLPGCRRAAQRESEGEPPVPVIAERVRLGTIRGKVGATGIVASLPGATYSVVAPQPARIADVTRNVGDAVKSGDVLVQFEFPSLRAQTVADAAAVKAAELRVQQARLTQTRLKALVTQGAASRAEMDDADRELTLAEGELATAKAAAAVSEAQSHNTIIRAPFDGTVTERLHNPGDSVRADESDPILRVIDPKQVQVIASVSVVDATRFTVGAIGRAIADVVTSRGDPASRPAIASPELLRVVSRPVPETGAKAVEVTLAFETPTTLPPGTQVAVEIDAEQRSNVPLVPATAVLKDDPAHPVVVVAAGDVAERREVAIGLVDAENIEILSGLKSGELIITQGHSTLRDGTPITISAP
jgi:membrane fusion protein (multidrug efflux system)